MTYLRKLYKIRILTIYILLPLLLTSCGKNKDSLDTYAQYTLASATISDTATAQPITSTDISISETEETISLLESMTIEEKIGQLFICAFKDEGYEFTENMEYSMTKYKPAGVVLFSEQINTQEQVSELIERFKSYSNIPLLVAVDEEGGRITRIGPLFDEKINAAGKTESIDDAQERGEEIGQRLRGLGFNMDFAPVADVNSNPRNMVIGDRAFSSDPDTAAEYVAAFINGMHREGILTVIKHFPGHGDTDEDSHQGIAVYKHNRQRLNDVELKPFIAGINAGADAVMIGHISVPEITGNHQPATFSEAIITDILRGELEYNGLVITDAMDMGAIVNNYSSGEAAVAALKAGADIILMPEDINEAFNAVMSAYMSGVLTEDRINESVLRVLLVKAKLNA